MALLGVRYTRPNNIRARMVTPVYSKTGTPNPLTISVREPLILRAFRPPAPSRRTSVLVKSGTPRLFRPALLNVRLLKTGIPRPLTSSLRNPLLTADPFFGGAGTITNVVMKQGAPAAYRLVRLYDKETGALLRITHTNAAGEYTFEGLAARPLGYYAVAHDSIDAVLKNAGVADFLFPEIP